MKKTNLFLFFIFFIHLAVFAQTTPSADNIAVQAQASIEKKEFTQARYLYLQASKSYISQQNITKGVECGIQAAMLYHRENYYNEAFDLCRNLDQYISIAEKSSGKQHPELHYQVDKMRLQMFIALKRLQQSKQFLDRINSFAAASHSDSLKDDYLYTESSYFYTFGMQQQGDNSLKALIDKYKEKKQYDKVSLAYKKLIWIAKKSNNTALLSQAYEKYIVWTDSVRIWTAKDELSVMKRKYDESQQTVQQKESSISTKNIFIIGLIVVIVILAAVLVFGAIVLLKYIAQTGKQKKVIKIANENNDAKTQFIQNISAQMAPTLNTLDKTELGVIALKSFSDHIQTLGHLENTITEKYEMSDLDTSMFCANLMDKIKDKIKPDVKIFVDAPKMTIKSNPEELERVLLHLLNNAAEHTPSEGKIWLEYKKRGGHAHQFIVSNTGKPIAEDKQENLFKPFSEVRDLSNGDGLGLPICALVATKLNGSLSLDRSFAKGCKFILDLHV